jgi:Cof subfamily protein (haloacid dehalogenase superfamily)
MTPIRLIASDLDGTLLRNDGSISPRTRDAIHAVKRAGLAFAFVTARPPTYIENLADSAGVTGVAVCSNGAILYNIGERAAWHRTGLAPGIARELVQTLRAALPELAFAAEHGHGVAYDSRFPVLRDESSPRVGEIDAFLDENLVKLLVYHPERDVELLAKSIAKLIGGLGEVNHSGGPQFIEIAASGVSKAAGLGRLCSSLNVLGSEVIAFGDMPNDLPMLRFAGRGVAVANAHPEVLAIADEITASNENDGVAQRIETLLDSVSRHPCGESPLATKASSRPEATL